MLKYRVLKARQCCNAQVLNLLFKRLLRKSFLFGIPPNGSPQRLNEDTLAERQNRLKGQR